MLEVSKEQFRRSWNRQEATAGKILNDNASKRMLLFYAVECGAKYLYMDKEHYRYYKRDVPEINRAGHDIKRLMKQLGMESRCNFINMVSNFNETIPPSDYQEMWRYGIDCKNAIENGKNIEENMLKALELLHDMEMRR